MLNILEGFPTGETEAGLAASLHLMIEAMKRAYADRARYLGDPAFVKVPIARPDRRSATPRSCARSIDPERATPVGRRSRRRRRPREGSNTTHFSIVDRCGNAVANTYTLNFSYGVGLVADGTGVLLNNELDDFTAAPGAPNAYGLVGFEANAAGPGQAAAVVDDADHRAEGRQAGAGHRLARRQPHHHRGAAGDRDNVLDYRMNVAAAVAAPRLHHQWLPDEVRVERGFRRRRACRS